MTEVSHNNKNNKKQRRKKYEYCKGIKEHRNPTRKAKV